MKWLTLAGGPRQVSFGTRSAGSDYSVWNDANEAKPQPFICEITKPPGGGWVAPANAATCPTSLG